MNKLYRIVEKRNNTYQANLIERVVKFKIYELFVYDRYET